MVFRARKKMLPKEENDKGAVQITPSEERNSEIIENFLKLTKARKWMTYEWMYSSIDSQFFVNNYFKELMQVSFPQLKMFQLTVFEWRKVRRLLVKTSQYHVRRCSRAFFCGQRIELERHRRRVRILQKFQSNIVQWNPNIGAAVTVFFSKTDFNVKGGTIMELQPVENSYKIKTSDGAIISVSDIDFCANAETAKAIALNRQVEKSMGNFPESLLNTIISLRKLFVLKRNRIKLLRNLIDAADAVKMDQDFATCFFNDFTCDLEMLNMEITRYYEHMKQYSLIQEIFSDVPTSFGPPVVFRKKCMQLVSQHMTATEIHSLPFSILQLIQILLTCTYTVIEYNAFDGNQQQWLEQFVFEHLDQLINSIQSVENVNACYERILPVLNNLIYKNYIDKK